MPSPRQQFLEIMAEAKSNRPELGTGADIYRVLVEPTSASYQADAEIMASEFA